MEELISERSDEESSLPMDDRWQESESRQADSWQVASGSGERDPESEARTGEGFSPLVESTSPKIGTASRRVLSYKPYFGHSLDSHGEGSGRWDFGGFLLNLAIICLIFSSFSWFCLFISSKKQRWEEELQHELASKRGLFYFLKFEGNQLLKLCLVSLSHGK